MLQRKNKVCEIQWAGFPYQRFLYLKRHVGEYGTQHNYTVTLNLYLFNDDFINCVCYKGQMLIVKDNFGRTQKEAVIQVFCKFSVVKGH
jgi:hypothetical protein